MHIPVRDLGAAVQTKQFNVPAVLRECPTEKTKKNKQHLCDGSQTELACLSPQGLNKN